MVDPARLTRRDLDGVLTWSLVRASRRAERVLTDVLREYGLTPVQFGVLAQLSVDGSLTPATLAREVLVRPQSMATLLEGMEDRGLVLRTAVRGRGRSNPIELTGPGASLLAAVWAPVLATNDVSGAGISTPQARALNSTLLRLMATPVPRPSARP